MPRDHSLEDRRDRIESRLEASLDPADRESLGPARAALAAGEDRWYGQLLALSAASTAGRTDPDTVLPAATSIELLRGYCRLRTDLLTRIDDAARRSPDGESASKLLAGDYLYTSAFSSLSGVRTDSLEPCVRTLTTASETIIGTFDAATGRSTESVPDPRSLVDGTAGALGEGAAVVGATLAGTDDANRARFARIGRSFAAVRQVNRILDAEHAQLAPVVSCGDVDEHRLRRHAKRRLEEGVRAVRELSTTAEMESLRSFLERRSSLDRSE